MSRKDIILISVLINAGLLAVLFVTALKTDSEPAEASATLDKVAEKVIALNPVQVQPVEVDEVDQILKEYLPEKYLSEATKEPSRAPLKETSPALVKEELLSGNLVDVVVKRGDALEKIARANRTTVEAIRKVNKLQKDMLQVGQVLKVPVGVLKEESVAPKVAIVSEEPVYYVVKGGDNPWKIAKNHGVKFEDLLLLNNLDEERAKNLKVGEKIRVR